jgi:hypothetical protein
VLDKALAEHAQVAYPKATTLRSDQGFLGYQPTVREHRQPKKSPRSRRSRPARNGATGS